jgi:hypothetical protein
VDIWEPDPADFQDHPKYQPGVRREGCTSLSRVMFIESDLA